MVKDLKSKLKKLGKILWTTWYGLDVLLMVAISIELLSMTNIGMIFTIVCIVLIMSYTIGDISERFF